MGMISKSPIAMAKLGNLNPMNRSILLVPWSRCQWQSIFVITNQKFKISQCLSVLR